MYSLDFEKLDRQKTQNTSIPELKHDEIRAYAEQKAREQAEERFKVEQDKDREHKAIFAVIAVSSLIGLAIIGFSLASIYR